MVVGAAAARSARFCLFKSVKPPAAPPTARVGAGASRPSSAASGSAWCSRASRRSISWLVARVACCLLRAWCSARGAPQRPACSCSCDVRLVADPDASCLAVSRGRPPTVGSETACRPPEHFLLPRRSLARGVKPPSGDQLHDEGLPLKRVTKPALAHAQQRPGSAPELVVGSLWFSLVQP